MFKLVTYVNLQIFSIKKARHGCISTTTTLYILYIAKSVETLQTPQLFH